MLSNIPTLRSLEPYFLIFSELLSQELFIEMF